MCGRFTLTATDSQLAEEFGIEIPGEVSPRYNIAPSQPIFAIRQDESDRRMLDVMQWGLIPSWVKTLASWKGNLINARVETVKEKPSFRSAFRYRPCLVPTSGFYEWTRNKQPHFYRVADRPLFALAGIWEAWTKEDSELVSCTILTTAANSDAAKIHHRMPIVVRPEDYGNWLGKLEQREQLLNNLPDPKIEIYPVSKLVNSPKNDTPECIKAISLSE